MTAAMPLGSQTQEGLMTVDVWWIAALDDDPTFAAGTGKQLTILHGEWANFTGNADSAASDVLSGYFDSQAWDDWIGLDDSRARVRLRIHSPEAIAGDYLVELERVTEARAVKRLVTEVR